MEATTGCGPAEQNPISPDVLFTPHERGHNRQRLDNLAASRALSKISADVSTGISSSPWFVYQKIIAFLNFEENPLDNLSVRRGVDLQLRGVYVTTGVSPVDLNDRQSRVLRGTVPPAIPKAARLLPTFFNGVAITLFGRRQLKDSVH
ncbi:MAG: hypothetical protein ACLQPD_32080 [Desulfomonilaceae bacterium]